MSAFIAHTPLTQMRPVGSEGERSYARVTALLVRHLTPEHAAILADPVPVRDGSGIDWYVDEEGDVEPLASLPPHEAQPLRSRLFALLADIRRVSGELSAAGQQQRSAALAISAASMFPDDSFVYALRTAGGWRPVLVGWGYESHDPMAVKAFSVAAYGADRPRGPRIVAPQGAPPQTAARPTELPFHQSPSPGPVPADPAPTPERARPWSRWLPSLAGLLGVVMFCLCVMLLLPACGLRTPFGTIVFGLPGERGCVAQTERLAADGRELEREFVVLQRDYQRRRISCLTQSRDTVPIAPAPQRSSLDNRFEQRVERRGGAQVTLVWDSADDLDLSLICPRGETISYRQKTECGGDLDIDRNADGPSMNPIENITFHNGLQQSGPHRLGVTLYQSRTGRPVPFVVRIRDKNGEREKRGQLSQKGETILIDEMRN